MMFESAGCRFGGAFERPGAVVDVRRFRDPDAGSLRHHCGINAAIQLRIIDNRKFPDLAREVEDLVRSGVERVAFVCKSGRHRSVACAEIFAGIYRGVAVHRHEPWCRHNCADCLAPLRADVLARARLA